MNYFSYTNKVECAQKYKKWLKTTKFFEGEDSFMQYMFFYENCCLKDHDKEVRKQVCDEIRENSELYDDWLEAYYSVNAEVLDQIEKGDKGGGNDLDQK